MPKRWRPQLRLSTILLLMTLVAVGVAWWDDHRRFADRIAGLERERDELNKALGVQSRLMGLLRYDPAGPWKPWNHEWDEFKTRVPEPIQVPPFRQ